MEGKHEEVKGGKPDSTCSPVVYGRGGNLLTPTTYSFLLYALDVGTWDPATNEIVSSCAPRPSQPPHKWSLDIVPESDATLRKQFRRVFKNRVPDMDVLYTQTGDRGILYRDAKTRETIFLAPLDTPDKARELQAQRQAMQSWNAKNPRLCCKPIDRSHSIIRFSMAECPCVCGKLNLFRCEAVDGTLMEWLCTIRRSIKERAEMVKAIVCLCADWDKTGFLNCYVSELDCIGYGILLGGDTVGLQCLLVDERFVQDGKKQHDTRSHKDIIIQTLRGYDEHRTRKASASFASSSSTSTLLSRMTTEQAAILQENTASILVDFDKCRTA